MLITLLFKRVIIKVKPVQRRNLPCYLIDYVRLKKYNKIHDDLLDLYSKSQLLVIFYRKIPIVALVIIIQAYNLLLVIIDYVYFFFVKEFLPVVANNN